MSVFQFKHFQILQADNAMKVGTDAMVLGASIESDGKQRGLDIGAGTGVLSLMVAQKNPTIEINAIEIDELASKECQVNLMSSPWSNRLSSICTDFMEFSSDEKYDLIFSNPPYYQTRNENREQRKAQARHERSLPVNEMIKKVGELIEVDGDFWIIIPAELGEMWKSHCEGNGLFLKQEIQIIGKEGGEVKRIIQNYSTTRSSLINKNLTVRNKDNKYTDEYIALTRDFHSKSLA